MKKKIKPKAVELTEDEKELLNRKLVNDALFKKKVGYTVREIMSRNLSDEQRARAVSEAIG